MLEGIFKNKENRFTAFLAFHGERKVVQSEPTVTLLRELKDIESRYSEVRDITSGIISQLITNSSDIERVIDVIDSEEFELLTGFISDRTGYDMFVLNSVITTLKKLHYKGEH